MNEKNEEKLRLYFQARALLAEKRKQQAKNSLQSFVDHYLQHLTTHKTPAFHRAIMGLMESMIMGSQMPPGTTQTGVADVGVKDGLTPASHLLTNGEKTQQMRNGPIEPKVIEKRGVCLSENLTDTEKTQLVESGSTEPLDSTEEGIRQIIPSIVEATASDSEQISQESEEVETNGENRAKIGGGGAPTSVENQNHTAPPYFFPEIPRKLLFIAPRGFAKSTLCSVFFPLWLALNEYKRDIFIVSATISLARELIRKIRYELEGNEKMLGDYGEQKSDKWTEEMLVLRNGAVIRGKGRGFQIRGFRPDIIVCDDLEDEEVIYSKEQRDKQEHWFFRTLLPSLKPDQGLLYVGTNLHQFSLISKLSKREEFEVRKYQALTDGVSIWEDLWPTKRLKELQRELGSYAFEAEYQNNPISLEDQPIKPEMLEGVLVKGKPVALCLAVDPAISERTSADERAFVLLAKMGEEQGLTGFKELYSEKGRWPVIEQVERILSIYERYSKLYADITFRVVVESVAFQRVYKDVLLAEARKRGLFIPVSEAELGVGSDKRARDKVTRLMQTVHLFEQRLVEIRNSDLAQELLAFPHGDSDNMVDACVYGLSWLMGFRSGSVFMKRPVLDPLKKYVDKKSYWLKEVRPGVYMTVDDGSRPDFRKKEGFISYGH